MKHIASFLLLLGLLACGGGSSAPIKVTVVGDSLTAGRNNAVTPVVRMQAALGSGYVLSDFSWPGRLASMALNGNPDGQPFTTFAALMQQRPEVAAILYGGADVMASDGPVRFEAEMRQLVDLAHAVGAKAVLATIIHLPPYEAQEAPFNDAIRRVAADTQSQLADAYTLTPGNTTDGVHPDQEWSDRRAALIAAAIRNAR
jgi:hypothetical protein